jgi:hypothetical protein
MLRLASCMVVSFLVRLPTEYRLRWSNYAWTFNTRHDLNARTRSHRFGSIYVRFRYSTSVFATRLAIQRYLPPTSISTNEFKVNQPTNTAMHFLTTASTLLFLTSSLQVLASPLTFTDIERRWSAGESDVSVHHDSSYSQLPRNKRPKYSNSNNP